MPVTTESQLVQTLESVVVHMGGAVDVNVRFEVPGFTSIVKCFTISQQEALPVWGSNPSGNISRWSDLCGTLYDILLARGDIAGTVS